MGQAFCFSARPRSGKRNSSLLPQVRWGSSTPVGSVEECIPSSESKLFGSSFARKVLCPQKFVFNGLLLGLGRANCEVRRGKTVI